MPDESELELIQKNTSDGDDMPDGVTPTEDIPQTSDPVVPS